MAKAFAWASLNSIRGFDDFRSVCLWLLLSLVRVSKPMCRGQRTRLHPWIIRSSSACVHFLLMPVEGSTVSDLLCVCDSVDDGEDWLTVKDGTHGLSSGESRAISSHASRTVYRLWPSYGAYAFLNGSCSTRSVW
ncbi:uncharacterized protein PHACADRAFT_261956 [Phanerochaete carnosa HHB-10118-sp]|uniref:Uncharacterized protein n=1 Tax=Phanerochaete carnosa (strain HHB-10118-sp) TaxID=650164 RepID=K5VJX9_PHACS|nr:uncharacterized protein PHACADRAFT_261956 [Phanerochaete carnosa HHB-10118-sp]EKM51673.1 hypothetical protein PHACADRAFT_261956 [Phanerochaete carnosa HHB-10118-sp]